MRKFISTAFVLAIALGVQAQNLDDIQEKINKGKYAEAKEKIDKALAEPKYQKNPSLWYFKGVAYAELAKDTTRKDMDYRMESYSALRKYQELDPKSPLLTLNQNGTYFALYEGYYNDGIRAFNRKDYARAYQDMSRALRVKDYIYGNKWEYNGFKFNALDTNLLNLTGAAASLAKLEDSAVIYYVPLAEAKVKGDDFKDLYPILVDYYGRKNDAANKTKFLAIGKELYPDNPYWTQAELEAAGDSKEARMAALKKMMDQNPDNGDIALEYGIELFNYVYQKEKPADFDARSVELEEVLAKAVQKNPKSAYANYIMTQHLGNEIYDLQEKYSANKSNKPEDIKKRQDINKQINAKTDEQTKYSQSAYDLYTTMDLAAMKPIEKKAFRDVTNNLADYYRSKKQLDKAKVYEDKVKTIR